MLEAKQFGRTATVAIAALMFGSITVLSAVGPARATEQHGLAAAAIETPTTVRSLA